MWLGIVYHYQKRLTEAEEALTKANKLSSGRSAEIHWHLARVYSDQGRPRDAASELEEVLKTQPEYEGAENIRKTIKILRERSQGG